MRTPEARMRAGTPSQPGPQHASSASAEYGGEPSLLSHPNKAAVGLDSAAVAEKQAQLANLVLPVVSPDHPLFPPLPFYETPTLARKIRYFAIQAVSFTLSLTFLTVIFTSALIWTASLGISSTISRLGGRAEVRRPFREEEEARRQARAESEQKWNLRQHKRDGDEEQGSDECPPLEGGEDPIVCDAAYYARRVGLDIETFRVQTEDGFILTLWHVYNPQEYTALSDEEREARGPTIFTEPRRNPLETPKANRRYPVLLIHGLLQSAGTFCTNDDDSLAFFLCKSGYDVWLGNNRCGLNPEHTTLPSHVGLGYRHLGTLDLAAFSSRVLYETGFEKLGLVCHSQGTAETFVALAKEHRPELGQRISVFCALAPAAYAGPLVHNPYFRFMHGISAKSFRLVFGIHSFIPIMMSARDILHPKLYGTLAYWVFSFLFGWTDARWERDLRHRMFQFSPVYVSSESMRWWLGNESFAKHRCILSTRDEPESNLQGNSDEAGDRAQDPFLGAQKAE
ncbi:hypothetical protein N7470_001561 [Penicillium chermesinum]|nr:hypothetical protein N7470_001561 [Penicillium chermesinum]